MPSPPPALSPMPQKTGPAGGAGGDADADALEAEAEEEFLLLDDLVPEVSAPAPPHTRSGMRSEAGGRGLLSSIASTHI